MGSGSTVAIKTTVTRLGTEEFYKEEYQAREMVKVTVTMAGLVVKKTREGGELLVRRIVFDGGTFVKQHCLMSTLTGDL